MIGLHAAGITDVGRQREGNEDALHVGDSVFAVADGMGGHQAGEVASALALEPLANLDGRVFGDVDEARAALADAVVEANRVVVDAAAHDRSLSGMGTTLTAALFEGRRLHVAHVGDSRAYLLRGDEVVQLTRDHTFVQQLLDDGRITEDEVATHPHRSVVTRAIGASVDVEVDLQTLDLAHGDAVLLCSDGLSGVVPQDQIAAVLRSDRSPAEVVTTLVDRANDGGGPDNITAVLLTVLDARGDEDSAPADEVDTARPPVADHELVIGGTLEEATAPTPRVAAAVDPDGPDAPAPADVEAIGGPADGAASTPAASDRPAPDADLADPAAAAPAAAGGGDHGIGRTTPPATSPTADGPRTDTPTTDGPTGPVTGSTAAEGADGADGADGRPGQAPGGRPLLIRPDGDAGSMRPLPGPGPDESLVVEPAVRRRRVASIVVAVATVLGLFVGGGWWLLSRSYFVGIEGDEVAIYKGVPATLGPLELSWVFEETGLSVDLLPTAQVEQLREDPAAANLGDARSIVRRYREVAEAQDGNDDGPTAPDGDTPDGNEDTPDDDPSDPSPDPTSSAPATEVAGDPPTPS